MESSAPGGDNGQYQMLLIDQFRLLLEEKRTSLMVMRTGILIILAQLAILGLMIAASRFYNMVEVPHLGIPFLLIHTLLLMFAFYLIAHSYWCIRRFDEELMRLKTKQGPSAEQVP
jgi:hypothetical protein